MLVGYKRDIDDDIVRNANLAREQKWASMQALKSREVGAKESEAGSKAVEARASVTRAASDMANSRTAAFSASETARHNKSAEDLDATKIKGDISYQTETIANEKTKTAQQGLKMAQEAPLLAAQASEANARAIEGTEKANLIKSGLQLRQEYLSPKTADEQRNRITSMYQGEQGIKPKDTRSVLPGQKVTVYENNRPVEKITDPLIVDEEAGQYETVKPAPPPAAIERLKSKVGTPDQQAYEDEFIKTFGILPRDYKRK